MRFLNLLFLVVCLPVIGADRYVATTGNDGNGGTDPVSDAWRTIQHALDTATSAGDVIHVSAGEYGESVTTKAHSITVVGSGAATLQAIRVNNHTNITLSGLTFSGTAATNTWGAMVRVESQSHSLTVTNCIGQEAPLLVRTNWVFDEADNSITGSGVDWAAAGFLVGSRIYTGGSSLTNNTYANVGSLLTIATIAGDKITVSESLVAETNSSTWAPIFPSVGDQYGIQFIKCIQSGGVAADNMLVTGCTVSNIYGTFWWGATNCDSVTITNNVIVNTRTRAWIHPYGNNLTVVDNFVRDSTNFVFYGNESAHHPEGGSQYYDYIQGNIHSVTPGTNVTFRRNWMQNYGQPLAQLSEVATSTNWLFESNVWVGFARNFSCGINGTTWRYNTFYRCAYDVGYTAALNVGGNSPSTPVTNMWIHNNLFVDCGDHQATNNESGFSLVDQTGGGWYSNYVTMGEYLGWSGVATFNSTNGVNGGDPKLYNISDPLGPDGLPFTADDGLRPLGGSAAAGFGALSVRTDLSASFTVSGQTPYVAGYDYDPVWTNALPWDRANVIRHWSTPADIGNIPLESQFTAYNSIGNWQTNTWKGPQDWRWDFGDDGTARTWWPAVSHTYLTTGAMDVVLMVIDRAGNSNQIQRTFNVQDVDGFGGTIWHVATTGNDTTGNGTEATPYATMAKAYLELSAGDYVRVNSGSYAEDLDCNRNIAGSSTRVSLIGYGAATERIRLRHPYHTVEGFDLSNPANGAGVYNYQAGDNQIIRNNLFHDMGDALVGGIYCAGSSTPSYAPTDQSTNVLITGNVFSNVTEIQIQIFGGLDYVVSNNIALNSKGEGDFIRPKGMGHRITRNWAYNLNNGASGGHPDFFQLENQGGNQYWFKDIVVEANWVEGIAPREVSSGAITLTKASNSVSVVASAPIFQEHMDDYDSPMSISPDGQTGDVWVWGITNYISSTEVEVASLYGITNATFQITDDDCQLAQIESGAFADAARYTNCIVRNNVFWNVRGQFNDSNDGLKFYNNLFKVSPRASTFVTTGGGVRGSSWGTVATNNILDGVGNSDSASVGYFYTATSGDQMTNTTFDGDYNFVTGTNGTAKSGIFDGNEATGGINGGDPGFADAANGNFVLLLSSTNYANGADLSAQFTDDFWGDTRTVWSIGPFESGASAVETVTRRAVVGTLRFGQ